MVAWMALAALGLPIWGFTNVYGIATINKQKYTQMGLQHEELAFDQEKLDWQQFQWYEDAIWEKAKFDYYQLQDALDWEHAIQEHQWRIEDINLIESYDQKQRAFQEEQTWLKYLMELDQSQRQWQQKAVSQGFAYASQLQQQSFDVMQGTLGAAKQLNQQRFQRDMQYQDMQFQVNMYNAKQDQLNADREAYMLDNAFKVQEEATSLFGETETMQQVAYILTELYRIAGRYQPPATDTLEKPESLRELFPESEFGMINSNALQHSGE